MAALSLKQNRANRRRARSFESLVQAGLAVIAVRGLYETTVEHITEAADVGKGTFYAHFPSKEDLVHHLVRLGFGELIAAGRAKVSSGSAATDLPPEWLRATVRRGAPRMGAAPAQGTQAPREDVKGNEGRGMVGPCPPARPGPFFYLHMRAAVTML